MPRPEVVPRLNMDSVTAAGIVRSRICALLSCADVAALFFTPSSLVALRIILPILGIRRLLLTDREYYTKSHFAGIETSICAFQDVMETVDRLRPDAVIVSVVGWQGASIPDLNFFQNLRSAAGGSTLLLADYGHAGAIGFPGVDELSADLTFGTPSRWIAPWTAKDQLGFLCARSQEVTIKLTEVFRAFYLATADDRLKLQSRWVDPAVIAQLWAWLEEHPVERADLACQHERNMRVARALAADLGLKSRIDSAILWLAEKSEHPSLNPFRRAGLVWDPPTGGTRILCREDILKQRASDSGDNIPSAANSR